MHSVVQLGRVLQHSHQPVAWRSLVPRQAHLRLRFQRGRRLLPARPRFHPSHNSGSGTLRIHARNSGMFFVQATHEALGMFKRLARRMG